MKLLVFGFGYSAQYIAERLRGAGVEITATVRTPAKAELLIQNGIRARVFSPDHRESELGVVLRFPSYREGLTALRADGEGSVGR